MAGLGGLALGAAAPAAGWAGLGGARFLSSARLPDQSYALIGIDGEGEEAFRLALPGRGHAAAAHPSQTIAVAFARRPGDFALVLDCATGEELARLHSPEGRHFYGHGAFSADGATLYTTENAYESGEGRIGVWDAATGFRRIGETPSGGIGPHDVKLVGGGGALVIANGGIRTHPESGRAKLNIPTMRPNLAWLSTKDGAIRNIVEPPEELRLNSLRHLAVAGDLVAVGAQWQGDEASAPPLLALHRPGRELIWADARLRDWASMSGYVGSVAIDATGDEVAITSPRGGTALIFDAATGSCSCRVAAADICGVAAFERGFATTTGRGIWAGRAADGALLRAARHRIEFDNHLIAV
ncbi:DUF1513 domain-containing protein [Pikeienuella piscinae]|uniref:DUF1513 domain-containing protein n=1 Tax=Pikeienuella piscinae TaxID=2748098 RepID=A0A7M3T6W6_9RHOB|nr:DUF1513 domain-containing protein [Pikeienuella piscinae]